MNAIEPIAMPSRNVYQRLSDARAEFHSLKLQKTGHNKFAGYKYFELGDFLVPALQVLSKHGLVGVVSFNNENAELRITNIDNPPESIYITSPMSTAALKGCHEVQNLGAVQTYIRRYLWVAALEIVEHDAVDSAAPIDEKKASKITPLGAIHDTDPAVKELMDDPEELAYLQNLAAELVQMVEVEGKPDDARNHVNAIQLSNDEKLALWTILQPNSKTRTAIKKAKPQESLAGVM